MRVIEIMKHAEIVKPQIEDWRTNLKWCSKYSDLNSLGVENKTKWLREVQWNERNGCMIEYKLCLEKQYTKPNEYINRKKDSNRGSKNRKKHEPPNGPKNRNNDTAKWRQKNEFKMK